MRKEITYKKQASGVDSWCVKVYNGDELVESYITFSRPLGWGGLRAGLITSKAFIRAIQNPNIVNQVAYGALQSVLSTEGSEENLKQMLDYTMEYSIEEKAEINKILSDNFFSISL